MPANGAQQRAQPPACSFTAEIPSTGAVHSGDNCTATRHGTASAYQRHRCRCPAACRDKKWQEYERAHGRPMTVDVTGTVRRIRALQAIGWTGRQIMAAAGWEGANLGAQIYQQARVTRATAARFADVYERLADTPGPSAYTRTRARNCGWLGPLWWDDDTIDDPDYHPERREQLTKHDIDPVAVDRACTGQLIRLTIAERHTAVARLTARGHNNTQIADLLHSTRDAIQQIQLRHLRPATLTIAQQEATA